MFLPPNMVISAFSSMFTFLHLFLGVETSKVYNLGTTLLASTSPPPSSRCSIGSPCYTINGPAGRVDSLDWVDSIWAPKLGIKHWDIRLGCFLSRYTACNTEWFTLISVVMYFGWKTMVQWLMKSGYTSWIILEWLLTMYRTLTCS